MLRRKSKRLQKMMIREHCKDVSAGELSFDSDDYIEVDFS
jgi:hypothetical protein